MIAFRRSIPVTVIIETCFLNDRFLKIACKIAENNGSAAVVTSSGYAPAGTKAEDIVKIKSIVGDKQKIYANGGIKTLDQVLELVSVGADRVCTGFAPQILEEAAARRRDGIIY